LTLFIRAKVQESDVWRQSRIDWHDYTRSILRHGRLFIYLVTLMAMMNFISHGSQDLYPTFLQRQRGLSAHATAIVAIVSMVGAVSGGIIFGFYSDRRGRRRSMVTAVLLALVLIPLWILAPSKPLIGAGAFLMQFMVQGAWGVIPAHINELSPDSLRGFFPGFAYQLGVLIASTVDYVEATLGEHFTYARSMGIMAAVALLAGATVIAAGPEARGIVFGSKRT
jgi:MFS transporter, SHS family, lactate transporter